MPSGTVGHGNGVRAPGDGPGDPGEVGVHRRGIGVGHDQRGGGSAFGANGAEDASPGVAGIARRARAGAAPGPDAGEGALLADPRVRHGPWTGGGTMANSWNHTSKGLSRA